MKPEPTPTTEIAVIGLAGRFPDCADVAAFWRCLTEGRSGVKSIQPPVGSRLPADPNYVAKAATVDQADCFDAAFFGILPRSAQEMDPQHRLFLEVSWQALEDAGYRPDATAGRVGLFAGCHQNTYIFLRLAADAELRRSLADSFPGGNLNAEILNDKDYLATRVAYHLNLRGPAVAVQTACSTSLVAVAQACQSLESGQSDMAIAGGVCVTFPQDQGYLHTEDSILSPDGHCRTFDASAQGTIFADGVGAVVLKRLADAQRDRDAIYAVIRGWGVNNDGGQKAGYTAPSIEGQRDAILQAHAKAQVSADTIRYVEAHGTGTLVGDPIEVAALTQAFRQTTDRQQYCAIGSLKSNFGHLDVAAGVTAVIKTALTLHHNQLPPNLHFRQPNPRIDFANSPFYVQAALTAWPPAPSDLGDLPRRAGVSSFGVGGTNAHLVMEEAPRSAASPSAAAPAGETPSEVCHLFCLSANSPGSLQRLQQAWCERLQIEPKLSLRDASYTLSEGRKPLPYRFTAVGRSAAEWHAALESAGKRQPVATPRGVPRRLFLFPGQGSQHRGMAQRLYRTERAFAQHLDAAAEALRPHVGIDLREVVFGSATEATRLDETAWAQPAIFMVSYALARWLQDRGVQPDAVMGHGVGEFAAATLAGIVSLEDGARLIAARGRLMQGLPPGGMLAITADVETVARRLPNGLEIAAYNAPQLQVVAGPRERIERLQAEIDGGAWGDDVSGRLLRTSHAFHSVMMDPAIEPFREVIAQCHWSAGHLPFVSTVTGEVLSAAEAVDPEYWAQQIRRPVQFSRALSQWLAREPRTVLCEVGPHQALTALARQHSLTGRTQVIVPLLPPARHPENDDQHAIAALGQMWEAGVPLSAVSDVEANRPRRLHLPVYPFERTRHWFEVTAEHREESLEKDLLETATLSSRQMASVDHPEPPLTGSSALPLAGFSGASGLRSSRESNPFGYELIQNQLEIMRRQADLLSQSSPTGG
jgi:acyl transferase domain-containing protein